MLKVADEFIVIDSGSTDATLQICQQFGLTVHHHAYTTHGTQMNYATSLASHDWVLCMDSDEILDDEVAAAILALKAGDEPDPAHRARLETALTSARDLIAGFMPQPRRASPKYQRPFTSWLRRRALGPAPHDQARRV